MTAPHKLWHVGDAVTVGEMQRVADAAAYADDRTQEAIFTPGVTGTQKRIVLLSNDTADQANALVQWSDASASWQVMPCRYIVGTAPYTIDASATSTTPMLFTLADNPGSPRTDLVYATLSLATTNTTRRVKDATSSAVTAQSVDVEEHWNITVNVAQGISGGAAGVLPADTATTYNFALATFPLASGYVHTMAGLQGLTSGISHVYERAWITPNRIRTMRPASIYSSTDAHKSAMTFPSGSFGTVQTIFFGFVFDSTFPVGSGTWIVLDNSTNYIARYILGGAIMRAADAGLYPPPRHFSTSASGAGGGTSASIRAAITPGYGNQDILAVTFPNGVAFTFKTGLNGELCVYASAYSAPLSSDGKDNYWGHITITDQFGY